VRLLIGNCQRQHFAKAALDDANKALKFANRLDVKISNYYSKRPVAIEAHLKAWLVKHNGSVSILQGSANLTRQGLLHNIELMAEPAAKDTFALTYAINSLYDKSWNAKPVIQKHLQPLATPPDNITAADHKQHYKTYHKRQHQHTRKNYKKQAKQQQQPTGNFLEESVKDFFKIFKHK